MTLQKSLKKIYVMNISLKVVYGLKQMDFNCNEHTNQKVVANDLLF